MFALEPSIQPPTEYSLTFPVPGTYPSMCLLHAELGQVGTVTVTG